MGRDDIVAVICSSQYSSIIPVDRDGQPTSNLVLWQDHRGTKKDLRHLPDFPRHADNPLDKLRWLRVHGIPPIADGLSMAHMRHLKFSRPDVYERSAWLLEPMDYVTMRLTGRATANQASAFMYLMTDNRRLDITDYDPHLVAASLIDREKLPELVPMDTIVGTLLPEVAEELGLSPSTRVVTALNDTQAGGRGRGCLRRHARGGVRGIDQRDDHARGLQAHRRVQQHREHAQPGARHLLRHGGERDGRRRAGALPDQHRLRQRPLQRRRGS